MDDLVRRLSSGPQPVEVVLRAGRRLEELRACIDRRFVHVKFTGTRGGTELGVPLDVDRCALGGADWSGGTGSVRLEGALTLNFEPVRCVADIDVGTLAGTGWLEVEAGGDQPG